MNIKLHNILGIALLALATNSAQAALVNSITGGTVIAMPVTNTFSAGPIVQAPGITWSSTYSSSVYGYGGGYGFGTDNGNWSGLTMVGLNTGEGTMTYSFANALSAVGGFINYAQYSGLPDGATPSIAIYDSGDNLLESATLNFNTGGGTNTGFFYGFTWATSAISYFKLSNAYIGLADLTIKEGAPSAVPVPAAAPLMLSALGLLGFARRRKQNT